MKRLNPKFAGVLAAVVLTWAAASFAPPPKDHDPSVGPTDNRPAEKGGKEAASEGCTARPDGLVSSANGESFDMDAVVTFLTAPACVEHAGQLSRQLVGQVTFGDKGPFRMDAYAKQLKSGDPAATERVQDTLAEKIPAMLRQHQLAAREWLPIVGQLTLLSPPAARAAMANLIAVELYSATEGAGKSLAKRLVQMGATDSAIAADMANQVEGLAVMVQADSLAKYFQNLAGAAATEKKLVPTYNLTSGALSRGVRRGTKIHSAEEQDELMKVLFRAIKASAAMGSPVDEANASLNEAMDALVRGRALSRTVLSSLWKEAVRVMASSPLQSALGHAVSKSLTTEFLFLPESELKNLFLAARNYPELALAIQSRYLLGWGRLWEAMNHGKVKPAAFRAAKTRTFIPMAQNILDLEPELVHPVWVREVVRRGLVGDDTVEKRFPRAVLALLRNRAKADRALASEGLEGTVQSLAEDMRLLWTLGHVYVPALSDWVDRQEANKSEDHDDTEP